MEITPTEHRVLMRLRDATHTVTELAEELGLHRSHVRKLVSRRLLPMGLLVSIGQTPNHGWVLALQPAGMRALTKARVVKPQLGRPEIRPSVETVHGLLSQRGPMKPEDISHRLSAPVSTVRRRLRKGADLGLLQVDVNRRTRAQIWRTA